MKMAKASEHEMDVIGKLTAVLNNVESGYYPMPMDGDGDDEPTFFDPDDNEHLRVFYDRVMAHMEAAPGGLFRVVGGFHTLMHNDIVDPDEDAIELHPRLQSALLDAERWNGVAKSKGYDGVEDALELAFDKKSITTPRAFLVLADTHEECRLAFKEDFHETETSVPLFARNSQ